MKKLFLLLATGLMAAGANAQSASTSLVFTKDTKATIHPAAPGSTLGRALENSKGTSRTTTGTGGGGWFNYVDSVLDKGVTISQPFSFTTMYFWQDTAATFRYNDAGTTGTIGYGVPSFGYSYNVSTGLGLDPFATTWTGSNTCITITPTNAYTIDSVIVLGIYGRPNGATYNDQLKFSFVYGDGSGTSNMPIGYFTDATLLGWYSLASPDTALWFPQMFWDSASNMATSAPGVTVAPVTYSFNLGASDTSTTFLFGKVFPVNVPVPAGNMAAMSVSFVSGATTFPPFPDTAAVENSDGSFNYGDFQPAVAYNTDASGNVMFPAYNGGEPGVTATGDYTTGYFKTEGATDGNGWSPEYVPNWALSGSTGGAYYQQYPYIIYHVTCSTCVNSCSEGIKAKVDNITSVNEYPNPAADQATIAFKLAAPSDVTITISDMMGQVLSTQNVTGTSNGKAVINTSVLPTGVYFYTFSANGERKTGRIVVAH